MAGRIQFKVSIVTDAVVHDLVPTLLSCVFLLTSPGWLPEPGPHELHFFMSRKPQTSLMISGSWLAVSCLLDLGLNVTFSKRLPMMPHPKIGPASAPYSLSQHPPYFLPIARQDPSRISSCLVLSTNMTLHQVSWEGRKSPEIATLTFSQNTYWEEGYPE